MNLRTDGAYVRKFPDDDSYFILSKGKMVERKRTFLDKISEVKNYGRTLDQFSFIIFRHIDRDENLEYEAMIFNNSGEFFKTLHYASKYVFDEMGFYKCEIDNHKILIYDKQSQVSHILKANHDSTVLWQGEMLEDPIEYLFCRFPNFTTLPKEWGKPKLEL